MLRTEEEYLELAKKHWETYLPKVSRAWKKKGIFDEKMKDRVKRSMKAMKSEYDNQIEQGLSDLLATSVAENTILPEWILVPEESDWEKNWDKT